MQYIAVYVASSIDKQHHSLASSIYNWRHCIGAIKPVAFHLLFRRWPRNGSVKVLVKYCPHIICSLLVDSEIEKWRARCGSRVISCHIWTHGTQRIISSVNQLLTIGPTFSRNIQVDFISLLVNVPFYSLHRWECIFHKYLKIGDLIDSSFGRLKNNMQFANGGFFYCVTNFSMFQIACPLYYMQYT